MSLLYCMQCKKWANKKHPCSTQSLISITKNMLPVALKADSLGLQVASAFCLTETHKHSTSVEADVYFKCIYPELLLQDLPTGWYWTDCISIEGKAICACIAYEAEYVDTGAMECIEGVINDLLDYLDTKDKNGLRALMLLHDSYIKEVIINDC